MIFAWALMAQCASMARLKCVCVFFARKADEGEPFPYATDEEHCLVAADAMPARHACERGVDRNQAMRPAAAGRFVEPDQSIEAGFVV
ncbi:MAG: hypothetical protein KGN36_19890, partial [Acidobacteriota bacterium]|nr:hypothetical protein [Acidobacteriota bacterium]